MRRCLRWNPRSRLWLCIRLIAPPSLGTLTDTISMLYDDMRTGKRSTVCRSETYYMQRFNRNKNTASNLWNWDFGLPSPACTTPDPSSLPASSIPPLLRTIRKWRLSAQRQRPSQCCPSLCLLNSLGVRCQWGTVYPDWCWADGALETEPLPN